MAALFFDSARKRRELENRLIERLDSRGFSEVILPVVDYLDPYQELLSEGSRQELYRFIDRDGEILALRGDFTPMLARLIAPRLSSLELPLRLFYRGDVLRYHKWSALQREFFQLGAEVLESETEGQHAERVALEQFVDLLVTSGCRDLLVVLGMAGALDALIFRGMGKYDLSDIMNSVVRRERRIARELGPALLQVVKNGQPDDPQELGDSAASRRLERLQAMRRDLAEKYPQVDFRIDLAEFADQPLEKQLRQHLGPRAYYDGLVFQAFGGSEGSRVGGGGRYDRLFKKLNSNVAAAGFCISVDLLFEHPEVPGRRVP